MSTIKIPNPAILPLLPFPTNLPEQPMYSDSEDNPTDRYYLVLTVNGVHAIAAYNENGQYFHSPSDCAKMIKPRVVAFAELPEPDGKETNQLKLERGKYIEKHIPKEASIRKKIITWTSANFAYGIGKTSCCGYEIHPNSDEQGGEYNLVCTLLEPVKPTIAVGSIEHCQEKATQHLKELLTRIFG